MTNIKKTAWKPLLYLFLITTFLFLATHALKYIRKLELIQLFRESQQLKSVYYNLLSLWAPDFQFHSPPEITLLSPQSRGTGGCRSAPAVLLKPPFFLSASVKCLIVRDCHDKRLRFLSCFSRLVHSNFSLVVLFFSYSVKMVVFYLSEKQSVDNRKF